MNWKRLTAWSLTIFLVPQLIGFLQGLSMVYWQLYGSTFEAAVANARPIRIVIISATLYILYVAFFRGTRTRKLAHAALLFTAAEMLDVVLSFALGARSLPDLFYWPAVLRHLAICAAAFVTVALFTLGSNYWLKRTADVGLR